MSGDGRGRGVSHGGGNGIYGLGLIGAWVYWWNHAHAFGAYVTGFLKALVWPAIVVYAALKGLHS